MKAANIIKAVLFAAAATGAEPSGASGDAAIRTDANGVYISNPTGKPMSEDLKGALEALHESEAKSVPVADSLSKGATAARRCWPPTSVGAGAPRG